MTQEENLVTDQDIKIGRRVNRKVAVLLTEIEKEEIPDRLMSRAKELQKALANNN